MQPEHKPNNYAFVSMVTDLDLYRQWEDNGYSQTEHGNYGGTNEFI